MVFMNNRIMEQWFDTFIPRIKEVSSYIFDHPELPYEEYLSSRCLADFLKEQGFDISLRTAGIDTAFTASYGHGSPVLGFLTEYDALPGLGHACGHNLLGTGAAAAACALKAYMETSDIEGTILVFGCPAEENMSGKIQMNKAGVFDCLDAAITWHPFDRNRISNDIWLAQDIKTYHFYGVSSHAARNPELGRSALDAAELMNIGVNYLREHVADDVRMHYAYTNAHAAANIVPDYVSTNYFVRSAKRARTDDASKRVDDCARGAALMTGTRVEIELESSCYEMKVNRELAETFYQAMIQIPVPTYTKEELTFARQISDEAGFANNGCLFTGLEPLEPEPVILSIGTDVSDVSHRVPTVTVSAAAMCKGTPLHHWAAAKQAGGSIGEKGMIYAARCMALGAKYLLEDPSHLKRAWAEHKNEKV